MAERWQVISIDLDDTLWPCFETIHAAEAVYHAWLEAHAPRVAARHTAQTLREHRMDYSRQYPEIAHDLTELRLRALSDLLQQHGYAPDLAEPANQVFREARNRVTPYPDVPGVLQALRSRFTLISLTNGNAQVEQTPLRGCFDHSLTAAQVGAAKPDRRMFEQARALTGVEWEQMLHVGDDPLRDVQAAARLNITAVWMNRSGSSWPAELAPPWLEVPDMHALKRTLL